MMLSHLLDTTCHTTGHAGPHPAVQWVTVEHQAVVEYQESRSTQWATQDAGRDYSPVATGRADCPPSVRRDPFSPRVDVASRTALCRLPTVSRSWIADDAVSIDSVTCSRSPQVSSTAFHAQPPDLPPVPWMDVGFAILCSLLRHRRPPIQFLFIGSRVCSTLLSDLASRLGPCASLILHLLQVG